MISSPVYDQAAYRIGNDNGSESAYTFAAAENTGINPTLIADANYSLRIAVTDAIASGAGTDDWQLQVSINGGAFNNVTTSSTGAKAFNSSNLTDGGATTARLTTVDTLTFNTFVAGLISEDGLADNLGLTSNGYTEFVFTITLVNADLNNADVLTFRILCNGVVLNSYTQTPTITITKTVAGGLFPAYCDSGHSGGMIIMGGM